MYCFIQHLILPILLPLEIIASGTPWRAPSVSHAPAALAKVDLRTPAFAGKSGIDRACGRRAHCSLKVYVLIAMNRDAHRGGIECKSWQLSSEQHKTGYNGGACNKSPCVFCGWESESLVSTRQLCSVKQSAGVGLPAISMQEKVGLIHECMVLLAIITHPGTKSFMGQTKRPNIMGEHLLESIAHVKPCLGLHPTVISQGLVSLKFLKH